MEEVTRLITVPVAGDGRYSSHGRPFPALARNGERGNDAADSWR